MIKLNENTKFGGKLNILWLLFFPFVLPIVDVGIGTVLIYFSSVVLFLFYVVLINNFVVNKFILLAYFISVALIFFVIIVQNSSLFYFSPVENIYFFRVTIFFLYFYLVSNYLNGRYFSREEAFVDFSKSLFWFIVISALFEYLLRGLSLQPILYLYKARQDLGGIDSVHYNRLSGFTSFPGDLAALIALSFICIDIFIKSKLKLFILLFLLLLTQSKAGIFLLFLYYAIKYISSFSFKGLLVLIISSVLIYYAVTFFELEYYLKFVNNLEHYAFKSKRAQEILYFLSSSWTEIFFGKFILDGMYFESEIFSSLNRNGILGSFWLVAIFAGFSFLFLVLKSKKEKELILFLIVFVLFYCVISAGFSRSKIGIFYIFIIAIFTVRNRGYCNRGDSCIV